MKVLFSDYDGTIKTFDRYANYFEKRTFKKNIDAIDKFLGNGNKFIITTKRNTYSILEELEKYKINYSYLTTYNGRVTLDSKNNIITKKEIHKELLKEIKSILENTDLITKIKAFDEHTITKEIENLIILYLYSDNIEKLHELIRQIARYYADIKVEGCFAPKRIKLNIEYTKKDGAKELIDLFNWNEKDVYSVGNGPNDYELLKKYNGFKIESSYYYDDLENFKTTPNIYKLIKKINNI